MPNQSGIYLKTDTLKWRDPRDQIGNRGTVVAVGPGLRRKGGGYLPMSVRAGDVVRFSEIEYRTESESGDRLALISEMDVVLVENGEAQ